MRRIQVPIIKMDEKTSWINYFTTPKIVGLFLLIICSGFLGALAQGRFALLNFPVFPVIDPKTQLGAVGDVHSGDTFAATNSETVKNTTELPVADQTGAVADEDSAPLFASATPSLSDATLVRINELSIFISNRENALRELNLELERIKDRSVTLIVEFNQNCGNWKDDCALPYTKELEKNNSRYSELIAKHATFKQELSDAQSERTTLAQ